MKNKEEKTILLVEDNPGDIRLIEEMLKEITSFNYKLIIAETLKDGCIQISKNKVDIILLDLNLPDSTGKNTFDTLIGIVKHIPVVLVSGMEDLALSVSIIREGAQDYINKNSLTNQLLEKSIQYSTERKKSERLQILSNEILTSFNSNNSLKDILDRVIKLIQQYTRFAAVGIRLKEGEDYPYFEQNGFTKDFLETENSLSSKDNSGAICRDEEGNVKLECTCGLVISGGESPLLNESGSFWTNNSYPLFEIPVEEGPGTNLRNKCVHVGFGSVALIPIRSNEKTVGLLQLNEKETNAFTKDMISFFEGICLSIGTLLMRKQAEEALQASKDFLDKIINSVASPIFVKDDKHKFCLVNDALCSLLNLPVEKLIGTTGYEYFPEEQMTVFIAKDQEVFRTGKENINEEQLTDGTGKIQNIITRKTLYTDTDGNKFLVGVINDITENRQKENELIIAKEQAEESRNKFQSIFLFAPTGIGVVKDSLITKVNQKLLEITGYSEGDLIGQSALILYPSKEEFDYVGKQRYLQINETRTGTVETKWRKKDGTIIEVVISSNSIFADDLHNGLTFTALDVTSRKLSEAIFKDIIEKNPLSIQILNLDGYTIQTNSAHTKLFGATPPADYSIFKDAQLLEQGLGDLFEQIKNGEIVHFPDSYFNAHDVDPSFPDVLAWIKATGFALNDSNGVPERIVLMHEDITARKYAEAMFEDIVDKNPLSIQIVDKDGYTITGNPAYLKLFGSFPPSGFSIFADLMGKSPEFEKLILLAKSGQVAHLPDTYYNPKDISPDFPDNPVWIRALIFPLNDSTGKPERYILMHENITERKLTEQELIIAKEHAEESDRLKSAFLANMSHEIRTPMNGILGFSELLKEPGLTGDQQQEYISIIEKSGARMLNIINDIVDISKIEANLMKVDIKDSNINEKIEFIYTFFKPQVEEKGMQLLFKNNMTAKEAIIRTDTEKFYSILTNLVKNAIKYSKKGTIEFGYIKKGETLEFYVKDTGIGIPKDRQSAIFDRFIQADITDIMARQGAGLGLSISKAYVEMLGGKIWVESEEGIGSTFYFTLPYNAELKEKIIIQNDLLPDRAELHIKNLKILIAEDDEVSEKLLSIGIRTFCKEILKARTGIEVIEVYRNNPDIDLILMDIQMPVMNGYEATQQIREFNKDVVIIAQTAYGLSGDREKAIKAGCNDYIAKPLNNNELLALIQKYFKS